MICMCACRKSSLGALLIFYQTKFTNARGRMQGRARDARAMHTPHTAPYIQTTCALILIDTTTYITASHPTHVAFRISARTTNAPPEAPREEQQRGCNRCRRARPAMPPCICPPQRHASPASPQPRWNRLVAAGGGPCACIPSWDVRDASLRCSTCWESTERSHGTQRCEGEKGMRGTRRSKERTGQGLWARPGAKLTGASRRSCWTKLSKRTCEPFVDRGRQKHLWRDPGSGLAEAYLREGAPMEEGGGVTAWILASQVMPYP